MEKKNLLAFFANITDSTGKTGNMSYRFLKIVQIEKNPVMVKFNSATITGRAKMMPINNRLRKDRNSGLAENVRISANSHHKTIHALLLVTGKVAQLLGFTSLILYGINKAWLGYLKGVGSARVIKEGFRE